MLDHSGSAPLGPPRHVLTALERLNGRITREFRARITRPPVGFRGSYGRLLDLLPDEGARPSELVGDAAITKQAIGQRVRELEQRGWVEVGPDPSDRRAILVRRTAAGDDLRRTLRATIDDMEASWAAQVGADRYTTFRAVLDELTGSLE